MGSVFRLCVYMESYVFMNLCVRTDYLLTYMILRYRVSAPFPKMVSALLMRASPLSAAQRERFSLCFAASRGILFSSVGALLYSCVGVLTKIVCSAGMPILNVNLNPEALYLRL